MFKRRIGGAGGGSDKGGGGFALVGIVVVAFGALGATGGVVGTGGVAGTSVGESVTVRKADAKKSARSGDSEAAWRRMGMREAKKVSRKDAECVAASHDQVQEFFLRTPCTSLDRMVLALDDGAGNSAVVSVVWVGFRGSTDVSRFKSVVDRHGSGDVYPLGTALLEMADIHFTGLNYDSEPNGKSIAIAETETARGSLDPELLDALAEVASRFPSP
ncbi:hypothetical protein [Umezawaea tangerina]|uniref:Uncharacterized protein n=1 Tax=Umezawaea tangerina TaxID=84725 RepID=A0A2T0SX24_9PSEU|nr:hypothetical protein [Umezawaea tangerina]PRY37955.1 hypothetical protein CLV43_109175 [Umezawaea tangerina]